MTRRSAQFASLTVAILSFALFAPSSSHAQVLAPGNRPPLSPWFGLYQRNGGPLDNYHTFVQPRIQLDNTLQRHHAAIQRNSAGVASLGHDLSQFEEQGVRPTGTGSVFMDYSHYYPGRGGGRSVQSAAHVRRIKPMQDASSGRVRAAEAAAH
jgi:hypothetical protein